MSGPLDVGDLISLLETSDLVSGQQVKELVLENLRSTKEGWLVNALIDSYVLSRSGRCLDIIAAVDEPHDKFVFDRLLDHLRGPNKLAAITILATLVYKRPSWLHKVLQNSVFYQLLKCLKDDSDVPVLLSGLLVVTAILPILPSTIHQYLPRIFETFGLLSAMCLKVNSELYKYHLRVGVYCLHNRLYGMFPYHFLTYLRNIYSRPEQQQVFEHVIKPMVDKLKLHPQLLTTTREKETAKERWRQKEVHDILVECAQFSLDLTEGSTSEIATPGTQRMSDHFVTGQKLHHAMADLASPAPGSLVCSVDPSSVLGLQRSGVATPPPGHETPSATTIAGARGPTPIHQGAALPSPAPDAEKTPKAKKRHSQTGLSLVGKIPTPTDPPIFPEGHCSVPPSPLKPDFTSDPPFSAQRMQAIRKLSFHQSESSSQQADVGRALEKVLANTEKFQARKPTNEANIQQSADKTDGQHEVTVQENVAGQRSSTDLTKTSGLPTARQTSRESGEFHLSESLLEASLDRAAFPPPLTTDTAAPTTPSSVDIGPSVTQLPKFLDTLDSHGEDATDNEVTEITTVTEADEDENSESSDTPSHLPPHLNTAESVAAFMKKVNRLRFNSINMARETASNGKINKTERSRSCPNFDPDKDGNHVNQPVEYRASTLPKQKVPRIPSMVDMQRRITRCNSSQTSLYALSTMMFDNKSRPKSPGIPAETSTVADHDDPELPFESFPYQELFSMSLPFSPYVQCYSCVMNQTVDGTTGKTADGKKKTQPALDDRVPLFASYSPAELLDRILDRGQMIHDSDQAASPGGSRVLGPVLSTCTDVAVLRGQIDMMHNQLMFERHKREMHAQRNRRLLSRIVKTTALEEQNNAMKDQLLLQEREMVILRKELTQQQSQGHQLKQAAATLETEAEKTAKSHKQALESLRNQNKELECQLETAKVNRDKANKAMQSLQSQVYTLSKEVEALTAQSVGTNELKVKVQQLNKELLLMGELQQKYQSRLVALNTAEGSNTHQQFLLDTYKVELNSVKNSLGQKTVQCDRAEKKLEDCMKKLQVKDDLIEQLKQMMESATDSHSTQMEAVESKYQALKRSHLALQTEFLTLNHELAMAKAAPPRVQTRRPGPYPIPMADPSGASTISREWGERRDGGDGQSLGRSGLRTPDCPSECSAPASVGSVESAEEAVAMDTSQ